MYRKPPLPSRRLKGFVMGRKTGLEAGQAGPPQGCLCTGVVRAGSAGPVRVERKGWRVLQVNIGTDWARAGMRVVVAEHSGECCQRQCWAVVSPGFGWMYYGLPNPGPSPEYSGYSLKSVTVLAGGWASTAPAESTARRQSEPRPLRPPAAPHPRGLTLCLVRGRQLCILTLGVCHGPPAKNLTGGRQGRPPFIVFCQPGRSRALSPGGHGCRHCESVTAGQARELEWLGFTVFTVSVERARVAASTTDPLIDLRVLLWAEKLDWRPAGPARSLFSVIVVGPCHRAVTAAATVSL
jgi:hypothetical protein